MNIPQGRVVSVLVYLERHKDRHLVGELTYDGKDKTYIFQYDKKYLRAKLLPLGPELPLNPKKFVSKQLFESFIDRLPSRETPTYGHHCAKEGIDMNEADPFVLLTTVGKRGPSSSSFVFEGQHKQAFSPESVKAFRKELRLTTKEFAQCFSIPEKMLVAIEEGVHKEPNVLQRLELYIQFPSAALFEFQRNSAEIHREKQRLVEQVLAQKVKEGAHKFQINLEPTKKRVRKKSN
jgi:HipA-like protein